MPKLRALSELNHAPKREVDERDLEAETAHRIRLLVARANKWRGNGQVRSHRSEAAESAAS